MKAQHRPKATFLQSEPYLSRQASSVSESYGMKKPLKRLQVCVKCGGYMSPQSAYSGDASTRAWSDETYHRSFGGIEMKMFVCEKCGHAEKYQVDDLAGIGEDD